MKLNKDGTFKELTAGEIKNMAIVVLLQLGFECWRQNNISVKGRKFTGRKGVLDILGYARQGGMIMMADVKTKNDRLSEEQKDMLIDINRCGGFGYVFEDNGMGGIKYYLYTHKK